MNDALRKKIAALRAKARDKSATEAEAMAAVQMAADLMQSAGLTDDDVEFDEVEIAIQTKGNSPRDLLWGTVATCTNTAATIQSGWTPSLLFVGRGAGPEIAKYLVVVLNRAVDRSIADFKETQTYRRRRTISTRRQAVSDFTVGLVARLRQRLMDMFAGSIDREEIEQARRIRDHRLPGSAPLQQRGRTVRFGSAASAGYTSGDRVQLAHGVGGADGAPLRIGSA